MKKLPISVHIIAKNEEERLPYALKSVVDWVDEIILVDSGSEDGTLEVARKYGAKFFHNPWNGYGPQKIFAESKCKNKWLLNIDADEAISDELRDSIMKLFENGAEPDKDAYKIKWKMIFLGQDYPPPLATGGEVIRFYNREKAHFRDSIVHDSVILKDGYRPERVGSLKGVFYHRCFKSLKHWMDKVNFYTTEQAQDWILRGRKTPSTLRILLEPFAAFLKCYFLRKYFAYGIDGFNASIIYAFSKTLRLAKVREAYRLSKK